MPGPNFHLPKRKVPQVDEFCLNNGLKGLFIDIADCSSMSVELHFQAGHYFAPPNQPELAHFLEHLVVGGNSDCPTQADFSKDFQRFGSNYNAHTNKRRVWYEFNAPDFDWQRSFELLLSAVSKPLFLPVEFTTEKQVVHQELSSQADNESLVFFETLGIKMGFWARPHKSRIEKLKAIDLASIKSYYQKTHGTANARLVVAGSLSPARRRWIKQRLENLDLPAKKAVWRAGPDEVLQPVGLFHRDNPKRQGVEYDLTFSNSQRRLELSEADTMAMMSDLFGDGFESRIYGPVRRLGLAYHIHFDAISTKTSAGFSFGGDANPDKLEAIIDLILAEIDRLLAGDLPTDELEAIKDKTLGDNLLSSFTPLYWAGHYRNHYLTRDLIVPADYHSRLEAIDPEKVIAIARHLFVPKQWTLGLHGPTSAPLKRRLKAKLDNWQPAG